jgi:DNA-binding CsgD family transcriptional regulator
VASTQRREAGVALSQREREVLQLVAEGFEIAAIAERLSLAYATVRTYLRSARSRLGARSAPHAVALALVMGEIEPVTHDEPGIPARSQR